MVPFFSGFTASLAVDDVVVDAVLDVGRPIGHAKDALRVGFVLGEEQGRVPLAVEVALAEHAGRTARTTPPPGRRTCCRVGWSAAVPGPLVAEPERRQDVQIGRLRGRGCGR